MRLTFSIVVLWFLAGMLLTAGDAPDLTRGIEKVELDAAECYHVRDLSILRDEARTFLTDGTLIFAKPVSGHRLAAVFSASGEGGDAELLLLPPNKAERKSLASFAKRPNLDEHFGAALLLFGDSTYQDLMRQVSEGETNRKVDGEAMARQWTPVAQRLAATFSARLALEVLQPSAAGGFFAEVISTRDLGNIDLVYDPRSNDQIVLGQLRDENDRSFFETWTSFQSKSFVNRPAVPEVAISSYDIVAKLDARLRLHCVTALTVRIQHGGGHAIPLEVSAQMVLLKATIDGRPAAFLDSNIVSTEFLEDARDRLFVIVPDQPLDPVVPHQIRIEHEGDVISQSGEGVFFVGSRGRWYPHRSAQFSTFDVTYEYPRTLDLVSAGELVSDTVNGDTRIVKKRLPAPVPFLGFNLGHYRCVEKAGAFAVKVCSSAEERTPERTEAIAAEITDALAFYTAQFGPPPLHDLIVSPIPGTFGQGFPGLIYLSANSYLAPTDPAMTRLDPALQFFYQDLLPAHELAHQWWGNIVSAATYRDEWLMEALANYSALLWLEKRMGSRATTELLASYRRGLLSMQDGQTLESAGPITHGHRLDSLKNPHTFDVIIYGKGTWILHMLRARMGDTAFRGILQRLARDYRQKTISVVEFRKICAAAMPKDAADHDLTGFFDQWVSSTGIPTLRLQSSSRASGGRWVVSGTVEQSDVDDDFQAEVPITVMLAGGGQVQSWIQTSSEPAHFAIKVNAQPLRVILDPVNSVLHR